MMHTKKRGGMGTILGVVLAMTTLGCGNTTSFEKISENGFHAADHAAAQNDYAWSMEYFVPDGKTEGALYAATGNGILETILFQYRYIAGLVSLADMPYFSPKIYRYAPETSATTWDKVFDFTEYEATPSSMGFRYMKTYRAKSDGVNYLYAATTGMKSRLFRSSTGEAGSWEEVWTVPTTIPDSIRCMEVHNNILYMALASDAIRQTRIARIWATDGATVWPVIEDGFGDSNNLGTMALKSFNGWLYAGTNNWATGYQVWKLEGPDGKSTPVKVVENGGPSAKNEIAGTFCVFNNQLYVGSLLFVGGFNLQSRNFLKPCDMIRLNADDTWETVVGDNSVGGVASGFGQKANSYIWWMEEHNGWLYASTYDASTMAQYILDNTGTFAEIAVGLIEAVQNNLLTSSTSDKRDATLVDLMVKAGADLYRSQDGVTWTPVTINGFGNVGNYGFRCMRSVGANLYVGTANPFDGAEVWKATDPIEVK